MKTVIYVAFCPVLNFLNRFGYKLFIFLDIFAIFMIYYI